MSDSFLTALRDELQSLLAPLFKAVGDAGARRRLLHAVGAGDALSDDGSLLAALQAADDLRRQIDQIASAPPESFAGIVALLQASSNLFAAVRSLGDSGTPALSRLGSDIVALLTGDYVRAEHPLVYRFGVLLTLIEPVDERSLMPGVAVDGQVVRAPFPYARIRFDRFAALVRDPAGTLRRAYLPGDLTMIADANATADALFPRIGAMLTELGVIWSYGIPDEDLALLGDATPYLDHAFQLRVPTSLAGDGVEMGLVVTLSSADRGDLGLVLTPFGTLAFSKELGQWLLEATLSADVQALALGRHGATFLAGASTTIIAGSFSASVVPLAPGTPALVFGSATGTRLELGGAKLAISIDVSSAEATVTLSAGVTSSALVVAAGDGDSFLKAILPADGLRATFDLGLTYSTKSGLALHGGAGLEVTLPVGLSLAGAATLQGIHVALRVDDTGVIVEASAIASLDIGPVRAVVDRMGITARASFPPEGGNVGLADLHLGFKSPTGLGLAIDTAGLVGGGFLEHDETAAQYAGVLQLEFESYQVQAFGLLATTLPTGPGYSLIAMIDAEFPPIPLGFGFTLNGAGGLFGVHRTASVDALRKAFAARTLSTLLFPTDPIANAPQLLTMLDTVFPAADGRYVFAPLVRIGWGTPTLLFLDVAIVLELPSPVRIVLLAEMQVFLPSPDLALVELHMSALGTIDFGRREAALDARLHPDSRLLSFTLQGSMALRVNWAGNKTFLLAIGGVNSKFQVPPGFPKLDPVGVSLSSGNIAKLNLVGYLAITSNTLQIGARVDLFVGVDGFGIAGYLGFDALIQFRPFHFDGDISGGVTLSFAGEDLLALRLAGTLSGPTPWHAEGSVSFDVLWWTVTKSFSHSFGLDPVAQPLDSVDVGQLLRDAFGDARNFSAVIANGRSPLVTLASVPESADVVLAHPAAVIDVHQRVVPLGLTISRFGNAAPLGDTQFDITGVWADNAQQWGTPMLDDFAPAQFLTLSDDDKLASPSFERLVSGVELGSATVFGSALPASAAINRTIAYDTFLVDTPDGQPREDTGVPWSLPLTILTASLAGGAAERASIATGGRQRYAGPRRDVMPAALDFVVATSDQLVASGVGASLGQSYAQARGALDAELAAHPQRRGGLRVVARYEVGT